MSLLEAAGKGGCSVSYTATPWAIDPHSDAETIAIHSPENDEHICIIQGQGEDGRLTERDEANAAFLVRACSAHDDLLAACKAMHNGMDVLFAMLVGKVPGFMPTKSGVWDAIVQGHAAIAKAKGGAP